MNKKKLFLKLFIIIAVITSSFVLSSCFTTTIGLMSCKRSCQESCKADNEGYYSGNEYGIYYTLSYDGESYMVSEVGYNETSVVIPETYEGKPVTGIKRGALTHYYSYGGVTGCGPSGYDVNLHLASLTLPKTIKTIEPGVFSWSDDGYYLSYGGKCDKLSFEGTLEDWFGIEFGSSPLNNNVDFYIGGKTVTHVVIPESVTAINENAFTCYGGLKSVTFHEKVALIGSNAFSNCTALKELNFPCAALTVGERAFAGCTGLETVSFTGENLVLEFAAFSDCAALSQVNWNSVGITVIPSYAFDSCYKLESFAIPASVEVIKDYAFSDCYNLAEVYNFSKLNVVAGATTHGGVAQYAGIVHTSEADGSYILTVGDYKIVISDAGNRLFKYTGEEAVLNLPVLDSGEFYVIDGSAFKNNNTIQSVNIPDCVTEIGASAFENCDNLKIVSGCQGLVKIGERAFFGCEKLESVALVKVETIGYGAFADSHPIKTLALPATVKEIGKGAFNGCTAEISYAGSLEDWGKVILAEDGVAATVTCSDGEVWEGKI